MPARPLLFLLTAIVFFGCNAVEEPADSKQEIEKSATVLPQNSWETVEPAAAGVNSAVLDSTLIYLSTHCKHNGLDETMIIRHGRVIWAGDCIDKVHDIWSCTKSFVSAAAGIMEAEGILSLDQTVAEHEPSLTELYPKVTYRHFLTMTSGFNAEGDSRWPDQTYADWSLTPYVPTTPLFAPGTAFTYWDEAMMLLGKAMTRASGSSLNDYLDERIFQKIGIRKQEWWGEGKTPEGLPIHFGGTGLRMSASEHARFGLLVLNEGRWREEQLIPADYLWAATSNQVPAHIALPKTGREDTDGRGIYGYNWWVINEGKDAPVAAAFTSGLNHNVCLIVPEWDMVIVRMGVDGNPAMSKHKVYSEVLRRLAAGIE